MVTYIYIFLLHLAYRHTAMGAAGPPPRKNRFGTTAEHLLGSAAADKRRRNNGQGQWDGGQGDSTGGQEEEERRTAEGGTVDSRRWNGRQLWWNRGQPGHFDPPSWCRRSLRSVRSVRSLGGSRGAGEGGGWPARRRALRPKTRGGGGLGHSPRARAHRATDTDTRTHRQTDTTTRVRRAGTHHAHTYKHQTSSWSSQEKLRLSSRGARIRITGLTSCACRRSYLPCSSPTPRCSRWPVVWFCCRVRVLSSRVAAWRACRSCCRRGCRWRSCCC